MLAARVAHLDEPFELGSDVSRVAIGAMADQHLDEVRRVGGEPISPVGVFEAEHLLPAALERQGDGDPVPSRRGDRHGAIDVVDEDAEPAPGRAATFGGDVAECLGDQPLGSLQPRRSAAPTGASIPNSRSKERRWSTASRNSWRRSVTTAQRRRRRWRRRRGSAPGVPPPSLSGGRAGRCCGRTPRHRAAVEQVAGEGEHGLVVALGPATGEIGHVTATRTPGASTPRREGFPP